MRAIHGLLYCVEVVGPGEVPARGIVLYRSAAAMLCSIMEGVAQMRWVQPTTTNSSTALQVACGSTIRFPCSLAVWVLENLLVMHYSPSVSKWSVYY